MAAPVQVPTIPRSDLPVLPALEGLAELAENLWWSWHPAARRLFARIDPEGWARTRNPVRLLRQTDAARWAALAADERFVADTRALIGRLHRYLDDPSPGLWPDQAGPIAYLCAEFALHESLPMYSGGLGVLAGDLCKAASDARLAMIAIGPFYRHGYFRQRIDADGRQEHLDPEMDPADLPVRPVATADGRRLQVTVTVSGREVHLAVWVAQVGRVPLLLLDADVDGNHPDDRRITDQLYDADRRVRLAQELLLGVGAARVLDALDIEPPVWHLNEGHSALLLLERARQARSQESALTPAAALRRAGRGVALTLHTPLPAGNERYDPALAQDVLSEGLAALQLEATDLCPPPGDPSTTNGPMLDLTAFALRQVDSVTAVSQLHARTATQTWGSVVGHDIPAVTNGVHVPTWQAEPLRSALDHAGGAPLTDRQLWDAHAEQKRQMIEFLGGRLTRQAVRHGVPAEAVGDLAGALDPHALTIGFARRFAAYKRADLILHDPARLAGLLSDPDRPVQLIVAGKAHPADHPGRGMLAAVVAASRRVGLAGRIFFIEDYDLRIARFLVAGTDLWLNTPRRPLEASGTSGMKAAINAVPSLSVLDGWWDEAFDGRNGWAIGGREPTVDADAADADALYSALEREIAPTYHDRGTDGLPARWIDIMRSAMAVGLARFTAERALAEYAERVYAPLTAGRAPALRGR